MQSPTATIFIEDLDRIDVTVFSAENGVVGGSFHVDMSVSGSLDENGFVHDFSPLKADVKKILKGTIDHALVIANEDKAVHYEHADGRIHVQLQDQRRSSPFLWEYEAPQDAVFIVDGATVTLGSMERAVEKHLQEGLPDAIDKVQVKLRPEECHPSEALFSYTHGITGHKGLCQRLLHGHRSKVRVDIDGVRRPEWEHKLVQELLGPTVHVAAPWQIDGDLPERFRRSADARPIKLRYEATRGMYSATIPEDQLLVIEGETSIENLTRFLADWVASKTDSNASVRVSCYEGIGKGSHAEA